MEKETRSGLSVLEPHLDLILAAVGNGQSYVSIARQLFTDHECKTSGPSIFRFLKRRAARIKSRQEILSFGNTQSENPQSGNAVYIATLQPYINNGQVQHLPVNNQSIQSVTRSDQKVIVHEPPVAKKETFRQISIDLQKDIDRKILMSIFNKYHINYDPADTIREMIVKDYGNLPKSI